MIMNIMFNMILKFAHHLCNWSEFWIFGDYEKQAYLNINTRLMFNIILKFAHYLCNRSDFWILGFLKDCKNCVPKYNLCVICIVCRKIEF